MGVAHFALDLGAGHHGSHRVNDNGVDGAAAHQRFTDLQRLFAGVRLAHQQAVDVHTQSPGVHRVQRVLHVDKGHLAAGLLRLCQHMQRQGSFAAGFRAVNLDHAAAGHAAYPQRNIQRQAAGADGVHLHGHVGAQLHHGALAELLFDLCQGGFQRVFFVPGRLALGGGDGFLFCHS